VKTLVLLPSFNESTNIRELTDAILKVHADLDVCVVDDSSPDGTADLVSELIEREAVWEGRVFLIVRDGKGGRGGAVRDGITWGIREARYEAFVEMDCDRSHDPTELPTGLQLLEDGYDVVIGARYPDGTIVGWPRYRRVFSRLANYLARALLEWSVADYTNGFRFYTPAAAATLAASPQVNTGFIYLSEALARLIRSGATVASFPITFRDRSGGESSADLGEVVRALTGLFGIAWWYRISSR
jgi:dolichol-phosphate mannosyltransferase